nr:NERD domain-containing protein/DEAD/DEAH box helicase [Marinobacter sp. S6332]
MKITKDKESCVVAVVYPDFENIQRLKVKPTDGELALVSFLKDNLDDTYEVFFNPYLDGDRPDVIILKKGVAVFVVEIKDWDLDSYSIDKSNSWKVFDGKKYNRIGSPHAQAFRYKKNLYDLHIPVVGLASLRNKNFFNLVDCFVYFHKSKNIDVDLIYDKAESEINEEKDIKNREFLEKIISFEVYSKSRDFLDRKSKQIKRDRFISIGCDQLESLIKKIKSKSTHVLFDDDVYFDFKRRLAPPKHTLSQGLKIDFDKNQYPITLSGPRMEKVKGVAGCGKTTVMAQRAINAAERHISPVLLLTFNITLKNYIKDKISDLKGCRDFEFLEITNYHQFFNSQINNTGQDMAMLIDEHGLAGLYSQDVFSGLLTIKYKTIVLDEVQDYMPEWVKIIRDNFLEEDGEMVLFGDEAQDIYHRHSDRARVIAQGFGKWIKLNRSYRIDSNSPLNSLFRDFQSKFLIEKYADSELYDSEMSQVGLSYGLLKYVPISKEGWYDDVFESVQNYMSEYDLHPNDVVILSSHVHVIRDLNDYWERRERTHCMFEDYEELESAVDVPKQRLKSMAESDLEKIINDNKSKIERIRRVKKNFFYSNSGLIKFSTIHSFKGLESKAVFYVMLKDDDPEVVYTSITRSAEDLVVYDVGRMNACSDFLEKAML